MASRPLFQPPITRCDTCPIGLAYPGRCAFVPVQWPARALLLGAGERSSQLFFVREGLVAIGSREDKDAPLVVRGPRSLFGLESLREEPAVADVWALTPVRVCTLAAKEAAAWVGGPDTPARAMFDLLADEVLQRQREQFWREGDVLVRLARLLLALEEGSPKGSPLSKQLLARILAMRPETLSRCLRRLEASGLIDAATTHVREPEGLSRVARGEASVPAA